LTEPTLLIAAHRAAFYLGDDAAERRFSASLVALARDRADIGVLPLAAARLAVSEMLAGHWAASGATATEVVQLARATRQEHLAGPGLVQLGLLAALRGEDEACRRYTEQACTVARRPTVILEDASRWALAVLDLARGDPGQAVNRLRGLTHPMVLVMSGLDRVEAASLSGAADLARSWADELVDHARQVVQPWTCARAAHAQALVGPAAEVDLHFAQALAHHEAANRPFEHGRTELAYGVALRRARRRAAARSHLRAAFDRFDALGAAPWAERAQSELRACGQAVSRRVAGGAVDRLTPQEVQVARFVARGLSNAEVAAQLFLSRRTVDFHLRNVFMKLGLTSRTELVRLVAEQVPAVADRAG